jgi:hypothetical protein
MLIFYENYSDNQYIMSFENFLDFYKDFSLFPDIVNLTQLKKIFSTLSEIYSSQVKQNRQVKIDLSEMKSISSHDMEHGKKLIKIEAINFNLFMDSLAMTAMNFKFSDQFKDVDKLLYLVERMNQSKGLNKLKSKKAKNL